MTVLGWQKNLKAERMLARILHSYLLYKVCQNRKQCCTEASKYYHQQYYQQTFLYSLVLVENVLGRLEMIGNHEILQDVCKSY